MEACRHSVASSIGLLFLRLGVGAYMATHGWGKVQMVMAGDFDKFTDPFGVSNTMALILAAIGEFVGPLLVMLGLGTRFAAALPVAAMGVAAFMVHTADPWTMEASRSSWRETPSSPRARSRRCCT